jgi:hypothetical protein
MEAFDGDIVRRLRILSAWAFDEGRTMAANVSTEAADEIERLRAELNRWKQPPTPTGTVLIGDREKK